MACKAIAKKMDGSPFHGVVVVTAVVEYTDKVLAFTEEEFIEAAGKHNLFDPKAWYQICKDLNEAAKK